MRREVLVGVEQFALFQNHPNPFNAATTIRYEVPEEANIHLTVHSVTGQVVQTLVAERHQPGVYRVGWDGTDSEGRPVASGIYFYQMWAGEIIDVKKMLLLK